jgi:hypothetical protein
MDWLPQDSAHIQNAVAAHSAYLLQHYGALYQKRFDERHSSDKQAGVAEAVVFTWLDSIGHNPGVLEDPSKGGADFICHPPSLPEFVVEATSLGQAPLSNKTLWPNDLDYQGGWFSLPVKLIQQRVRQKIPQLSKHPMPRVLAIVSSHIGATAFMSDETAKQFLLGGYKFGSAIGDPHKQYQWAALENAVFIRRDGNDPDRVVADAQTLSALLLIALDAVGFSIVGILHPEPHFSLDPHAFSKVPFLYVSTWPAIEGKIHIDWTADTHPLSTRVHLKPISL